jgi:hypothetical protein
MTKARPRSRPASTSNRVRYVTQGTLS